MKKLGILGGISSASTIDYYKKIMELYYKKFGNYYYPEINIESLNFQYFTDLENKNAMTEYKAYILQGIQNLQKAGSEVIIMAANSPHSVFSDINSQSHIPIISIVDSVAKRAANLNLKKVLLTGIKYTMQHSFYHDGFKAFNIEVIIPSSEEQDIIEKIIFDELVIGRVSPTSQCEFLNIIKNYVRTENIDGVILGCTELPALVNNLKSSVTFLNTLQIHCEETLNYILNTNYMEK